MTMPVHGVYVHFIAHSQDVPVNSVTNFHVQVKVTVNITINAYTNTEIKGSWLFRATLQLFLCEIHLYYNQGYQNQL